MLCVVISVLLCVPRSITVGLLSLCHCVYRITVAMRSLSTRQWCRPPSQTHDMPIFTIEWGHTPYLSSHYSTCSSHEGSS